MLKPNANYKMSKGNKIFLSNCLDAHRRNDYKKVIIQEELYGALQPKREKKPRLDLTPDAEDNA